MSDSFATLWTVASQAPLSMGFPIGLIISSSMLIHIINLQKGGPVYSDSLNLFREEFDLGNPVFRHQDGLV